MHLVDIEQPFGADGSSGHSFTPQQQTPESALFTKQFAPKCRAANKHSKHHRRAVFQAIPTESSDLGVREVSAAVRSHQHVILIQIPPQSGEPIPDFNGKHLLYPARARRSSPCEFAALNECPSPTTLKPWSKKQPKPASPRSPRRRASASTSWAFTPGRIAAIPLSNSRTIR